MRLNFEFPEERINELKALQMETGTESMKELLNTALTALEWLVEETKNGSEIAAINEERKTYRVLVMPILEGIARKHQRQSLVMAEW